jgi:hypothetical protein
VGLEKDATSLSTHDEPVFVPGELTFAEIVIPNDDPFGVSSLAGGGCERSEVYTSHAEVLVSARFHHLGTQEMGRPLRSTTKEDDNIAKLLHGMFNALKPATKLSSLRYSTSSEIKLVNLSCGYSLAT